MVQEEGVRGRQCGRWSGPKRDPQLDAWSIGTRAGTDADPGQTSARWGELVDRQALVYQPEE